MGRVFPGAKGDILTNREGLALIAFAVPALDHRMQPHPT